METSSQGPNWKALKITPEMQAAYMAQLARELSQRPAQSTFSRLTAPQLSLETYTQNAQAAIKQFNSSLENADDYRTWVQQQTQTTRAAQDPITKWFLRDMISQQARAIKRLGHAESSEAIGSALEGLYLEGKKLNNVLEIVFAINFLKKKLELLTESSSTSTEEASAARSSRVTPQTQQTSVAALTQPVPPPTPTTLPPAAQATRTSQLPVTPPASTPVPQTPPVTPPTPTPTPAPVPASVALTPTPA